MQRMCAKTANPSQSFQIDFDFIDHLLKLQTSKGDIETIGLGPRTVADFYMELMARLRGLGLETQIWTMPVEIPDAIPFEHDRTHAAYDPEYVTRFWQILVQVERVLTRFRARSPSPDEPLAEPGRLGHAGSLLA